MKLRRLDIRILAGLDAPFSLTFEPDRVNFITGPNASGKSSIVRAVRALLYPELNPDFCHLRASWQLGSQTLECERHGTTVTWLEGTQPAPPPRLPDSDSLGAYLVSSEELTRLGSTESHIAGRIRTMLAGGYDLDAVLEESPLRAPPRPQKQAREFAELRQKIRAKEDEYARLSDEIDTLGRLNRELESTGDAGNRLRACEDALALADSVARRNALEHSLIEEYPGGMDRLRGDELTRLDQIQHQLDERRKERQVTLGSLEKSEERLNRSGAVDPHGLEVLQSELADYRDRLLEVEREIDACQGRLEEARRDQAEASQRLGGQRPQLDAELDHEQLEHFERLVDRVMMQREKIRNLSGELARSHVPRTEAAKTPDTLRIARQALLDWLEHCRLTALEGVLWGGLGAAALLAAWRVLGPRELDVVPELILLILIAAGVPLTLLVKFIDRFRTLTRSRARFEQTGVEGPLGWAESEVEARVARLDQELEAATHQSVQQARAGEVRERLNSERAALEQVREKLTNHAETLGLSAENRMETGFLLWCRHLKDWQEAMQSASHQEQRLQTLDRRRQALAAEAGDLLKRHKVQLDGDVDSRSLASLINQLGPRIRSHAELHNEIRAARHRLDELDADIEQLTGQHRDVFESAGVHPGDLETLTRRIENFEQWRHLEQQRRDCALEISRLENRLSAEKDLLRMATEQERQALESLREEVGELAHRRDELNRQVAAIHTRHEDLLERRELETLTGELETRGLALADELDRHLVATAGELLIDDVRTAHQADNEPTALARASRWFERFTRQRYRLVFGEDQFQAFDTRVERNQGISQLSTGTRAQLLLALRLAWMEQAERDSEPLPVFMDEVLTTTDPDRYRLVVESVQDILAGGRQLFYLTAQSDEATAWAAWSGDGPGPHTIDLGEVRHDQVEPLSLSMPRGEERRRDVPPPNGLEPEEWARQAGVGAINPWQGSGLISVFHLMHDDLELAADLIRAELGHLGELSTYLDASADPRLIPEATQALLRRRCRAAAIIIESWRKRHDRPVDAAALHTFGRLSDTFLPRVADLAASVDGDPRKLLDGLRGGKVPRFRADVAAELEDWLEQNGYLAEERSETAITAAELASRTGLEVEESALLREWITSAIDDPLVEGPGTRD